MANDAYEYNRARATIHTVAQLRSEIAELGTMMDGLKAVDYSRDKVSASASDDGMVNEITRIESLREEYREELERYVQAQADAHAALRNVRQPWQAVLTYRYVEGLPWVNVAKSAEDASDILGVTRARVYAMVKDGILDGRKVGNSVLVSTASVKDRFDNPRGAGKPTAKTTPMA